MLSTNIVESNENGDDGVTTKVSITNLPVSQKYDAYRGVRTGPRLPKAKSPPFADATDTDDNSDEYEERKLERVQVVDRTSSCSNQRQPSYCSLQCYKAAAESNIIHNRYSISKLNMTAQ